MATQIGPFGSTLSEKLLKVPTCGVSPPTVASSGVETGIAVGHRARMSLQSAGGSQGGFLFRVMLIGALLWAAASAAQAATKVSIIRGNVICTEAGRTLALTHDGKESDAKLSPDGHTVAFIHQIKPSPEPDFPDDATSALWLGDCKTANIRQLAAPASDKDMFASMGAPIFSLDGRVIYVTLVPGGDYLVVHQVDVLTGQHRFLVDAELQGIIRNGPYRGDLLATQHTDLVGRDGQHYGGYPFYIFTPDGKTVMRIPDSENWKGHGLKRWLKARRWQVW
jgi:hypothetical protein